MDDAAFQALINGPPADGSADQGAIVRQLRDQNEMGQLYGFSPELAPQGAQMQKSALSSAKDIGDRRQQGLTRTRQAEQDKLDREKYEQTLKGYTDIEEYTDADGKPVTRGISKRTGEMEDIQTGYSEVQKKYGSSVYRKMTIPGYPDAGFRINDAGNIQGPYGQMFDGFEDFSAKHPDLASVALKNQYAQEFGKQRAKDTAEEVQVSIEDTKATQASGSDAIMTYNDIVTQIDDGAWSGPYTSWIRSFDNATLLLEKAMANLTLTGLTKHKLTPVSDKDLAYVKMSEAPNLTPQGLKRWATHKAEATKRVVEANAFMEEWYRENQRMPTKADKKLIDPYIKDIMYGGGFEYSFSPDAAERRDATETGGGAVPKALASRVSQADWDSYTPAQRAQLAD